MNIMNDADRVVQVLNRIAFNTRCNPASAAALGDPSLQAAINEIESIYGDTVSVAQKSKSLIKFGRNPNVGTTPATLWWTGQDAANETFVATNLNTIDTISSANAGDNQLVVIEGHTETGGDKTFVIQQATLNGQNKVVLTTPLNRMTRIANLGSTDFAGEIYGYEDTAIVSGKPTDTTKIHITVPLGANQSQKASTALSSQDYWLITSVYADVLEKTSSFADISLQVRNSGGVFRTIYTFSATDAGGGQSPDSMPVIIVQPNSDVRLVAVASGAGTDVSGGIAGHLAIIV